MSQEEEARITSPDDLNEYSFNSLHSPFQDILLMKSVALGDIPGVSVNVNSDSSYKAYSAEQLVNAMPLEQKFDLYQRIVKESLKTGYLNPDVTDLDYEEDPYEEAIRSGLDNYSDIVMSGMTVKSAEEMDNDLTDEDTAEDKDDFAESDLESEEEL